MKKIIFSLIFLFTVYHYFQNREVSYGPGILAPHEPDQENIKASQHFTFEDYKITPLAQFRLKARVLSREDYSLGRESDLSPMDLALGWGRMSDESVFREISISQSGRWYRLRWKQPPIPLREIQTHSANMHLIPATTEVESLMKEVRKGHVIALQGSLIEVEDSDGWRWRSSLSRGDTGGHSCELIWVEDFKILQPRESPRPRP